MRHAYRSDEPMIDTMIALAAVDKPQRVIVAGSDAFELYRDLARAAASSV